jgi:tol-pal system protein YbgF
MTPTPFSMSGSDVVRPSREPQWLPAGRRLMALACGLLLLITGCASRQQVMLIQEDTQRLQANADTLKDQDRALMQSISDLKDQVRDVQTKTEYGSSALQERVEALAARLDELVTRMDRTLAPLEEFIRRQAATDTSQSGGGGGMGVDYYDAAQRDLSLGNYDLAEVGFLQYLQNNPKSDLADDARYGLAETYYARKRYDDAIQEYQRVIQMNPKGGKAAAAMLKIGLANRAEGDNPEARKTFESLLKLFPYSDEAKIAQQRLDEMKRR